MKRILIFMFICTTAQAIGQTELSGKVVNVIDGNTVEVSGSDNQIQKLVFAGIDSPELGQEYGDKAKKFLEKLLLDKDVKFSVTGKDRWGNHLAVIMKGNVDPRVELLEEGLAWTAEKNPNPELEALRMNALEKAKGLWKEENPTPPWIYRRQQSMMQAKSN
jgi:endonuclease YncB( thermonuclease family)